MRIHRDAPKTPKSPNWSSHTTPTTPPVLNGGVVVEKAEQKTEYLYRNEATGKNRVGTPLFHRKIPTNTRATRFSFLRLNSNLLQHRVLYVFRLVIPV